MQHLSHATLSVGALAGKVEHVAAVRAMHNVLGGVLDPHAAWLLLRGMKTLGVRVRQQNATAHTIARRCAPHDPGTGVLLVLLCVCGNVR